jgi:hypothetical protein
MTDSHFFKLFRFILVCSLNYISPFAGFPQQKQEMYLPDIPTLAHHSPAFSACANGVSPDRGIRIRTVTACALRRRSRTGFAPVSPVGTL